VADLLAGIVDMDRFNQEAWQQLRQIQKHLQGVNDHAANEVLLDSTMLCFKADALIADIGTCIHAAAKCRHDATSWCSTSRSWSKERPR
jgi:hypothetical protein